MTTTNEDLIAHARNLADPDQYKRLRAKDKRTFGKLADALAAVPAPTEADRETLRRVVGGVLFNVMNFPERVQSRLLGQDMGPLNEKITDAILPLFRRVPAPKTQDGEALATEFEYGIRWEDGSEVCWDTRSEAEYELRGTYPNMIGQLIERTVTRGPWLPVSPEGGETPEPVFEAMGLPPVPPFPSIHPEGGE